MGRTRKPRKGLFCWLNIFMTRIFLHTKQDAWLVSQTIAVLALPWLIMHQDFVWWLILWPVHFFLLLNALNTSLHHHTHWGTFKSKTWDKIYELAVSASCAFSTQQYRKSHTIHHKHVNDIPTEGNTKDPISVFQRGQNGQRENVWLFCASRTAYALILPYRNILSLFGLIPKIPLTFMQYHAWRREQWASVALFVSVLIVNPVYGLWMIGMIYAPAFFLNYSWHYGEHYGAHHLRGDTTQDSVGIYNWWYNTFCFRSGYHQEHHHRPGVHWHKLDQVTPMLPESRVRVSGMHVTNNPWWSDFKQLFKLSSN
jgi:fatty acid desaturase